MTVARRTSIVAGKETSAPPAVIPDNPKTPAFWIAEGQFRRHLFSERAAHLLEKPRVQKYDTRHPSKLYSVEVWGTQPSQRETSIAETSPAAELEEIALKKEVTRKEAAPAERPLLPDMTYLPPMKEPVPPHQPRRVLRSHHIYRHKLI